jgi:N-hydroxyarylamine O-acetyltransferase
MTVDSVQPQEHYTHDQIITILNKINYPLSDPNVLPDPTLETLKELQYRFVTSIPFENLSLRTTKSRCVDITLEGIFDRVIHQRRGGWCFSLNRLAFEVLYAIGFNVRYTLGRGCKPPHYNDPIVYGGLTHRISIIRFEDGTKYAFDIGFGDTSYYPLQLKDGATVEYFGHQRRLTKVFHNEEKPEVLGNSPTEMWRVEQYLGEDKWIPCYAFTEAQYYDKDCDIGNFYASCSPSSFFTKAFMCVQGTLDGKYYILAGKEFKIRDGTGVVKAITFEKEQERLDTLEKYFGIALTEEELSYHDLKLE